MGKDELSINKDVLQWHFQHVLEQAQHALDHLAVSFRDIPDAQGFSHKQWIESLSLMWHHHLDEMKQELQQDM
jgi:hypothetical protein